MVRPYTIGANVMMQRHEDEMRKERKRREKRKIKGKEDHKIEKENEIEANKIRESKIKEREGMMTIVK